MEIGPLSDSDLQDADLDFLSFQDSLATEEYSLETTQCETGNKRQRSKRRRPTDGSGKWTKEEDAMLKSLVHSLDPDWDQVSQHFPHRHKSEVQRRWENSFDPRIKKTPWTPEEDAQVLALLDRFGSVWKRIAKHMVGRPPDHIKNRYYGHLKSTHPPADRSEGEQWENPDIYLVPFSQEKKRPISASAASLLAMLKNSVTQMENDLKDAKMKINALDGELKERKRSAEG